MGEIVAFNFREPKKCRWCKLALAVADSEFCGFACQDNWYKKYAEDQEMIINILRNKCPQYYLTTDLIFMDISGELLPIGLFMCMKCNKPITHFQFNWSSGVCGYCDSARTAPRWIIKVPEQLQEFKPKFNDRGMKMTPQ